MRCLGSHWLLDSYGWAWVWVPRDSRVHCIRYGPDLFSADMVLDDQFHV